MAIKPIETMYKGYRFRSRLEARWAVFFDAIEIKWEYEKEGYNLGDGMLYLPDFWLPEQSCWVEIKGEKPDEKEGDKAAKLATATGIPVYIFWGPIPSNIDDMPGTSAYLYWPGGGWDCLQWWCECKECKAVGIQFEGRADRLIHKDGCSRNAPEYDRGHNYDSKRIIDAYLAARSARFEHGESGAQ